MTDNSSYDSAIEWANKTSGPPSKNPNGINWIWIIIFLVVIFALIWWFNSKVMPVSNTAYQPETQIDQMKQASQSTS